MTILVSGATGATGGLLVTQLLDRGQSVKAVVRSPDSLPESIRHHERLSIVHTSLLDLTDTELAQHAQGCTAVASYLGHTMSFKGIYGNPRRLVTDATIWLCKAIHSNNPDTTTKFVLMNTAGNSNRDLHEPVSFGEKYVIGLVRLLVPPHANSEQAEEDACYLQQGCFLT